MNKINTNFGVMYIETLEYDHHRPYDREEGDRIKVYDSLERYLDYWSIDTLTSIQKGNQTLEDVYKELIEHYENATRIDLIVPDIVYKTTDLCQMALYMLADEAIESEGIRTALINNNYKAIETIVLENEWINKIGEWYIYVQE